MVKPMRTFLVSLGVCAFVALSAGAQARDLTEAAFQKWLQDSLWPRAQNMGLSRSAYDKAMAGVRLQLDLPELVAHGSAQDAQSEFRAPAAYFREDMMQAVVRDGQTNAVRHARALARAAAATGVPAHILVAIWGRESTFGQAALPHDAVAVLATKAYAGRRSGFYQQELLAALTMLQTRRVSRGQMRSSWAGALGQPQFMPSSYLKYGADGDGDGRVDIWASVPDTLMSIGTYLSAHGWTKGRDWGFEVIVPKAVSCALEGQDRGRSILEWQRMGVKRVSGKSFPEHELRGQGYLLMPAGRAGPAFLVTPNFFVLKNYNNSDLYALYVGHSGDRIAYGMGPFVTSWDRFEAFRRNEITALQKGLVARGYDVGGVDGFIGTKTRRAIGLWQAAQGKAETCFPDREALKRLAR